MSNLPQTIDEAQAGLKKRKFSTVDLVNGYLKEISQKNNKLNAYITVSDDLAFAQAKKADRVIKDNPKAFEEFPLLGIPFSLKDLFLTKNLRTTAGSKVLENYIPQYSSTVYKRLRKAGAILLGKTNCDAWAHGGSGENSDYGATKNPYNTDHVPGGSSSGSAVSVSADMALFSMGTDTGGSVRQPAGFCNVVGLKPTYGAVPRYGVVAMASSTDSMGHFTRTAKDSKAIFEVTRGKDRFDSNVKNERVEVPEKITIGIPKEYFENGLDKEVHSIVQSAISNFKNLDINFEEISLPHTKYAVAAYYIVQPAEVSSNLGRYDGVGSGQRR